jgi:hypothetical protein
MALGTILGITMARDIMLPGTIGDLTGIRTIAVPIGGTGTGGITAGTGIDRPDELVTLSFPSASPPGQPDRSR